MPRGSGTRHGTSPGIRHREPSTGGRTAAPGNTTTSGAGGGTGLDPAGAGHRTGPGSDDKPRLRPFASLRSAALLHGVPRAQLAPLLRVRPHDGACGSESADSSSAATFSPSPFAFGPSPPSGALRSCAACLAPIGPAPAGPTECRSVRLRIGGFIIRRHVQPFALRLWPFASLRSAALLRGVPRAHRPRSRGTDRTTERAAPDRRIHHPPRHRRIDEARRPVRRPCRTTSAGHLR